ncbi:hypothetical protein ACFHYN_04315 [Pasteurella multocida]|uniref:hypothetical protein n=1 Tax=Pasteurella multocida TaxID=747 RepID=UPI0020244D9F|nr:hypothetical protein [Pasteurella multocida]MEB3477438.1 hypothetical protein [Pasteurella multocida]URJ87404.1 hypothetical protein M9421_01445 [Pasteurella multocida]URJ89394.1 hypothetical protein M9412_01430 [Pasteurella multocida]HDR0618632.1 hypothetical protein [Pasteurella multocida]HDR1130591.1 hypothetical protein [Pasteurella multocida]
MLIYINQFELVDKNSCDEAFHLISQWLTKNVNKKISKEFLKSGKELSIRNSHIRTYIADELEPYLYSILFTHPDKNVSGRQWITEISIKSENNKTEISISLEVSDISTRVKEYPKTTKPYLVALLNKNKYLSPDTIGLKVNQLKNDINEFKALDYEINKEDREYSIVLVSKRRHSDEFLLKPNKLQEQLVGLAKVVSIDENVDLKDLESYIGDNSVWDGAVRIIYPPRVKHTKLFRSREITKLNDLGNDVYHEFLSFITHTTNGFNKRKHFSPTDVRSKRSRDRIKILKAQVKDNKDYENLANQAFDELEKQNDIFNNKKDEFKAEIDELSFKNLELEEEVKKLKQDKYNLENRITHSKKDREITKKRGLLNYGNETDLYPDEIKDLVLSIIETHYKNTNLDKNDRQYKILEDVINKNEKIEYANKIIKECKRIFTNYSSITNKMKSDLSKLNLIVVEDGTHNKLKFINDDRFIAVFAKTSSDDKTSKNILNHIKKALLHSFVNI